MFETRRRFGGHPYVCDGEYELVDILSDNQDELFAAIPSFNEFKIWFVGRSTDTNPKWEYAAFLYRLVGEPTHDKEVEKLELEADAQNYSLVEQLKYWRDNLARNW